MLLVVSGLITRSMSAQWTQRLSKISPATYALDGIRAAILDGASLASLATAAARGPRAPPGSSSAGLGLQPGRGVREAAHRQAERSVMDGEREITELPHGDRAGHEGLRGRLQAGAPDVLITPAQGEAQPPPAARRRRCAWSRGSSGRSPAAAPRSARPPGRTYMVLLLPEHRRRGRLAAACSSVSSRRPVTTAARSSRRASREGDATVKAFAARFGLREALRE